MIKFSAVSIIVLAIIFIILSIINGRRKLKKKPLDIAIDSVTLSSGVVLFLYLFGLALDFEYFKQIDEFSLLIALFIAGISLISSATDKYKKIKGRKKNG